MTAMIVKYGKSNNSQSLRPSSESFRRASGFFSSNSFDSILSSSTTSTSKSEIKRPLLLAGAICVVTLLFASLVMMIVILTSNKPTKHQHGDKVINSSDDWKLENLDSDTSSISSLSPVCKANNSTLFNLDFYSDKRAHETNWNIHDSSNNGALVASLENKRTIGEYFTNEEYYSYSECLPSGSCYTFTISDVGGDGMCCYNGAGWYTVTIDGVEIKNGGEFGYSELTSFGKC